MQRALQAKPPTRPPAGDTGRLCTSSSERTVFQPVTGAINYRIKQPVQPANPKMDEPEMQELVDRAVVICVSLVAYVITRHHLRKRQRPQISYGNILGGTPTESTAAESSGKRIEPAAAESSGKRRKKDDDDGVVSHLLGGLTEVAQALTLASANTVPVGLFDEVMATPDFEENDLVRVYDYLVLHKLEALGFLGKPTKHRQRWIREQFGYT